MRISECYIILGIKQKQQQQQLINERIIRSAYLKRALQCHPDRHRNNKNATQEFQNLTTAYTTLCAHVSKNTQNYTDVPHAQENMNTMESMQPQDWAWAFEKLNYQARVFWKECPESHLIKQLWRQCQQSTSQSIPTCEVQKKTLQRSPHKDIVLCFDVSEDDVKQSVQHKLTYTQSTYKKHTTEWQEISSTQKQLLVSSVHEHVVFYEQGHLVDGVYGNVEVFLHIK